MVSHGLSIGLDPNRLSCRVLAPQLGRETPLFPGQDVHNSRRSQLPLMLSHQGGFRLCCKDKEGEMLW